MDSIDGLIELCPMTIGAAKIYISEHHRHHNPPPGGLFAVGVKAGGAIVGVAIVGRPVARMLDDGSTCEVTRLCTDGTPNACSMLYGACRRAAKALGYTRIITYILASEPGTSLRAAGWVASSIESKGGSWDRPSRKRTDAHPTEPKQRYEARLSRLATDGEAKYGQH